MKAGIQLNGEAPSKIECDFLVCCDGGYDYLKAKNITPDVLLGDMDSVKSTVDMDVIKFKPEKDATDGELAVDYLIKKGVSEIEFYGVFGGRPDHVEGNYNLLYKAFLSGIKAVAVSDYWTMEITDKPFTMKNAKNKTISVVPFLDFVHINGQKGLKYPMDDLTISKGSTIGISNFALDDEITINIDRGVAMIFVINRG